MKREVTNITALDEEQGQCGLKEGASSNDGIQLLNSPGDYGNNILPKHKAPHQG